MLCGTPWNQLRLFLCRQDFQPVAIGVGDKVNAHGRVFVADAAHFLMELVGGIEVFGFKGQMEFAFTQIIALRMVFQPGQLQLEAALFIAHVNEDKAVAVLAAHFLQS